MNIPLVEFFKSEMHHLHAHWFLYADGTPFNPDVFDRKVGRSPRNVKAVQTKSLSRLPEYWRGKHTILLLHLKLLLIYLKI